MIADNRVAPRETCVIRYMLDRLARDNPDKVFAKFDDEREVSFSALHAMVVRTAAGLQRLGVKQGDRVLCWLPNDLDALNIYLGSAYLGAMFVPINTAYKGGTLQHVINLSDADLLVLHADLAQRLSGLSLPKLAKAVVLEGTATLPEAIRSYGPEALSPVQPDLEPLKRPIEPWDCVCITFTSGTTGPSKAVMSSYLHYFALSDPVASKFISGDDRYLITTPLFHISSTARVYAMLLVSGSIAMVGAFRTSDFWDVVRRTGSTTATLMGAMATFLMQNPPHAEDRNHGLRTAAMLPLIDKASTFVDRFGVDVYTFYNMTETSRPIVSELNPATLGGCGRARPGVQLRIVDANDCEVAPGEIGELIVRTDAPWAMSHGYFRDLPATAKAWRNGWFHTGDGFRKNVDGEYFFMDRLGDSIRRRGENISSFQVESEVLAHPAVREVAAFPVPSEHGESEVMIAVSAARGCELDPAELLAFLVPRMPYFAVPRFVRIMDELPKTPTQKIQKHLLRSEGIVSGVVDREMLGITVKREKLSAAV